MHTWRERLKDRRVVASVSGGKDSTAMCLWLMEQGIEFDRVFCDTGWEHPDTYDYLNNVLEPRLGRIERLHGPHTFKELVRARGMFPSSMRRFCTVELKVKPLADYINARVAAGEDLVNAIGIRAAESLQRRAHPAWEEQDGFDCEVWRPILGFTEADVIEIHKRHDVPPNPLYVSGPGKVGVSRVGCWPCIHAKKSDLRVLAETDPARIEEIRQLEEELTAAAQARADAKGIPLKHRRTFFQARVGPAGAWPIDRAVAWSRSDRRGQFLSLELFAAPSALSGCARWGRCDVPYENEKDCD